MLDLELEMILKTCGTSLDKYGSRALSTCLATIKLFNRIYTRVQTGGIDTQAMMVLIIDSCRRGGTIGGSNNDECEDSDRSASPFHMHNFFSDPITIKMEG